MSRAMNVKLSESEVIAKCATASVSISAIEALPAGGTHFVCTTSDGAATMRTKFRKDIIEGRVKRSAFASVRFTA